MFVTVDNWRFNFVRITISFLVEGEVIRFTNLFYSPI